MKAEILCAEYTEHLEFPENTAFCGVSLRHESVDDMEYGFNINTCLNEVFPGCIFEEIKRTLSNGIHVVFKPYIFPNDEHITKICSELQGLVGTEVYWNGIYIKITY